MSELNDLLNYGEPEHRIDDRKDERVRRVIRRERYLSLISGLVKLAAVAVIFYAALVYIDQKAFIYEINARNIVLEKEIVNLDGKISEMNVRISSRFSLEKIYEIASTELDMIYPTASRVVSIKSSNYYTLENGINSVRLGFESFVREK